MVFGFIKKALNKVFSRKEKKEKDRTDKAKPKKINSNAKALIKIFKEAPKPQGKQKGNIGAFAKHLALTRRRAYLAAISRKRNRRMAKKKFRRSGKIAIGH